MRRNRWHFLGAIRSLAIVSLFLLPVVLAACGGSSKPAATQAPAAAANLMLAADTVMGSTNVPQDQTAERSCVLNNRFPKNSQIVWRARIYDPKTGDLMDDKAISKMQAKLGNGVTVDMKYGAHPKGGQEYFWTGSWIIPLDQATGTLKYSITATSADGRTGEYTQLNSATSLLTITDASFPTKQG